MDFNSIVAHDIEVQDAFEYLDLINNLFDSTVRVALKANL